jgi:hypothetical protein
MAIKIKATEHKESYPARLVAIARKAFETSTVSKMFDELAKAARGEIKSYLEDNDDGFDLTSKTLKFDEGSITWTERGTTKFNKDQIMELIESGAISLVSVLEASNFADAKMKVALGSHYDSCVESRSVTEIITVKPTAEFKEQIHAGFGNKADAPKAEKPAKKKSFKRKSKEEKAFSEPAISDDDIEASLAKVNKAAKKSKPKSVNEDLDAILNEV